jgi:hypothetical protein
MNGVGVSVGKASDEGSLCHGGTDGERRGTYRGVRRANRDHEPQRRQRGTPQLTRPKTPTRVLHGQIHGLWALDPRRSTDNIILPNRTDTARPRHDSNVRPAD